MRRIKSITLYRDRDIRLETLPVVTFFQVCGVHVCLQDTILMDEYTKNHYTTTIVSEISSSRVYTKLYTTTDFSIVIRSPLHPLKYSDHIIGDKYVELNYVVGKNVSELIDRILEFMLDSIYEQIDKCDDLDTVIQHYLGEALKDTVEINCTAYYLLTRTPQFFDAIELYNNTAFFSIVNTECINQLDQIIRTLLNPRDEGLRGLESCLPWKCLMQGLKYRSEIIRKIFNHSPTELFETEPDLDITDVEFIKWLSYGNYNYLPPDFMYENSIALHSDTECICDNDDKEIICGDMDYSAGLYQQARDHWRRCTIDTSFRIAKSYQKDMDNPAYASIRLSRKRSASTWYQEYLDKNESDFEKGNITLIELYHIYVAMKHLSSVTCEDNQEFEFDWRPELEITSSVIMRRINKYLTSYNIDQFDSNDIINAIILRYDKEFAVDRIDNDES